MRTLAQYAFVSHRQRLIGALVPGSRSPWSDAAAPTAAHAWTLLPWAGTGADRIRAASLDMIRPVAVHIDRRYEP